jgi:hypothetical protein
LSDFFAPAKQPEPFATHAAFRSAAELLIKQLGDTQASATLLKNFES